MIYGNLRSTYSPTGKEYVTRWNPLMKAIGGIQDEQPKETTKIKAGEFGSGMSSGAESGGPGDFSGGDKGTGGKGGENVSGTSGDFGGFGFGSGYGVGGTLGNIGSVAGLAGGIPGAGVVGNAIGTAIDTSIANQGLAQTGLPGIGFGGFLSGVLNNATFGALGESIGSQWGNSLNNNSPYGSVDPQSGYDVGAPDPFGPGGTLADPYGGVDPNAGAAGGVDGGYQGGGFSGSANGEAGLGGYYSRGGHVNAKDLQGPDPVGPDDGYGGLDHGEFVLRAAAVEKLGPEVLQKLNSGDFRKAALVKALLGK